MIFLEREDIWSKGNEIKSYDDAGYGPVIPALGRQRGESLKFKASLGYRVRACLKKPWAGDSSSVGVVECLACPRP
jgi:hypothetical protein